MLINNAGGQFPQRARDFKPKGWNAVIETNLTGTWNMTQVFGNQMLDGRGGTITNVIAVIGRGFPGIAHTAAARAGVLASSRFATIRNYERLQALLLPPSERTYARAATGK